MWRYLVGMLAGVLLVAGGLLWWQNSAAARRAAPVLPLHLAGRPVDAASDDVPEPPQASEKTREQKRFSRYDHDRNGAVSRDEFLAARRKAFAKLDLDGNGQLSFDEYAAKTEKRFGDADGDRSGALTPVEFAITKIQHKTRASPRCPPAQATRHDDDDQG